MNANDIQAMRELLNNATPGIWEWTLPRDGEITKWWAVESHGDGNRRAVDFGSKTNAVFASAAHNNMAELLDLAEIGLKARGNNP